MLIDVQMSAVSWDQILIEGRRADTPLYDFSFSLSRSLSSSASTTSV